MDVSFVALIMVSAMHANVVTIRLADQQQETADSGYIALEQNEQRR